MPPLNWEISLASFRFPRALPSRRANFRVVADLRYVTGRGEHATEHAVLPALDRWWECDPGHAGDLDYVRGPDEGESGTLDVAKVDDWDRLVLLVRGDAIHSLQLRVYDVNRRGAVDRVLRGVGEVIGTLAGRARAALPDVAGVFSDSLGSASSDLESALVAQMAGADRLLFRGSARLGEPGAYRIAGAGEAGDYELAVELRTV
ncbi:MAG: hypothetical protein RRA92_08275 [Gemmatimonadota bacterium]|nr:hypothetical protein [Gemmatimonadota bacterium]